MYNLGVFTSFNNDTVVQLSDKASSCFCINALISIGCVNAFVGLQSHETKLSLFGKWKKDLKVQFKVLFVEVLCDMILQSTLKFHCTACHETIFIMAKMNCQFRNLHSFYLIGSIKYFFEISYFLSYFSVNGV